MTEFSWEEFSAADYACRGCGFIYDSRSLAPYDGPYDDATGLPSRCPRCGAEMPDWERPRDIRQREQEDARLNTHTEREEFKMMRYPDRTCDA